MVDTNGNPDNDMMYDHWNTIQMDASSRMRQIHSIRTQGDDLTSGAKAAKIVITKAGTGHNPSSCATCQAYAGLPPVAE